MPAKFFSVLIGYFCGCFLTAEVVARKKTGKSASELGKTGNPGMANITASLGLIPGILTLAGDLGKCILAGLLSFALFREEGWIVVFYAGLGCTLGHDFPFWKHFKGGKGVATTSMAICLYAFRPGLTANIAGMLVLLVTGYLCIGGPAIPLTFTILMLVSGETEGALISAVLTALSLYRHGRAILLIRKGETDKTDLPGKIFQRRRKT